MKKASKPRKKTTATKTTKRAARSTTGRRTDELRPAYDFRGGTRGKYASRFQAGSNVVVLDPDVAAAFKDADAVNHALRTLLELVPGAAQPKRRSRTAQ